MADSVTQLLASGPTGTKRNILVLGDGFAAGDQAIYDKKVDALFTNGVFAHDYFMEDKSAFNVFRMNLVSRESGMSERKYHEHGTPADATDDTILSETLRDTALGYIYNGSHAHFWLEEGAHTALLRDAAVRMVDDVHYVVVILNIMKFGGSNTDNVQVVTMKVDWPTMAHELGHGIGVLTDEYCTGGRYTEAGEPDRANATVNTDRDTLKWRQFVGPSTPIPTGRTPAGSEECAGYSGVKPAGWIDTQDVGLFEGGRTKSHGVYRPALMCRMSVDTEPYCPVCYTELKNKHDLHTGHTFLNCVAADLNGNGKDDLLVHDGSSILVHRSTGDAFEVAFSSAGRLPLAWQFAANDQFFVGDFNGDGKDEVLVFNGTDWDTPALGLLAGDRDCKLRLVAVYNGALPNWQMGRHDRLLVGDFGGNGRDDFFVFNGSDWSTRSLGMFSCTGTAFEFVSRFDGSFGEWQLGAHDQLYVGDFDGDGRADLMIFNGTDSARRWFGMFRSTGDGLDQTVLYQDTLGDWKMGPGDKHFVGDFDGDGKDDLYVFNGSDWNTTHLGMLRSDGTELQAVEIYDGKVPKWKLAAGDRFHVADTDRSGKAGLIVYNATDWDTQFLGTMTSSGDALHCEWVKDWVGEWNLSPDDRFLPCNYQGGAGQPNLLAHNRDWLGLMDAAPAPDLRRRYFRWVHNYRHGRNW